MERIFLICHATSLIMSSSRLCKCSTTLCTWKAK